MESLDAHELAARAAYADACGGDEGQRSLHWRGTPYLPPDAVVRIARAACPNGYNEFSADVLAALLAGQDVTVAFGRELSPVVYVRGPATSLEEIAARARAAGVDEVDPEDGKVGIEVGGDLRLWWD